MAHLYFKAKETAAAEQPPEVRILKHLLTMEDPMERNEAMDQAFEPGEAGKDGADQDFLTSCAAEPSPAAQCPSSSCA